MIVDLTRLKEISEIEFNDIVKDVIIEDDHVSHFIPGHFQGFAQLPRRAPRPLRNFRLSSLFILMLSAPVLL